MDYVERLCLENDAFLNRVFDKKIACVLKGHDKFEMKLNKMYSRCRKEMTTDLHRFDCKCVIHHMDQYYFSKEYLKKAFRNIEEQHYKRYMKITLYI